MNPWNKALREGLVTGTLASILSTAALALAGRRETGHPAAPTNAVSHWYWDQEALHEDRVTARHTLLGYVTHHAASVFWTTLYARVWPRDRHRGTAVPGAVATSAIAAFVDFKLTPRRLTPGFEHRLSTPALVAVYACFAAGIALGTIAMDLAEEAGESLDTWPLDD